MSAFIDTAFDPANIERARAGDEAALAAIYRAFEIPVRTLTRRLVTPRFAAEDVAQDVFVDVITRLYQYEGRGSFAGWIRSIAVSRCLMHLRSPWHRGQRWLAGATRSIDELHQDWRAERRPAAAADRATAIDLERALARLGDVARAVVWLHDVEGYTHAEIGALFGASASFSKSQLARAHARLRDLLHVAGDGTSCIPVSSAP
ncbi:MAG: sigma-70 family RNA polymerase sigma factor [Gammaproteobacteria bacterium]|nr:sigma-70 family RNA polymerase sigma factor [Gammaproteobacteria bacterium]MDH4310587.1 sigma-70 family RNA polymerase sigma factor [Gammaproteobacteria bacterium]MDH5271935.1 sigma-70 family RNA polymerase sigma factor [Gammaproteobacteria bacterium]